MRHYSLLDKLFIRLNDSLSLVSTPAQRERANPATGAPEIELTDAERKQAEAFVRIDHTGEVCAQALYDAQLRFAKDEATRQMLHEAKQEEMDHLAWCEDRLCELNGRPSYLNFYWYWHSFLIGSLAGFAGDRWSLGFVDETEAQVAKHLADHLQRLAPQDQKTRVILQQMQLDEEQHGENAMAAGGQRLPQWARWFMAVNAKVMTTLTYYV